MPRDNHDAFPPSPWRRRRQSPRRYALVDGLPCFDCHSNESRWPWYSNIAPISWLVQHDVDEGRAELNFSEWNRPQKEAVEAAATVENGEMPPAIYVPLHADAKLTAPEKATLAEGLRAMFGAKVAATEQR